MLKPKSRIVWMVLVWIVAFLMSLAISIPIARPSSDALPLWIIIMAVVTTAIIALILWRQRITDSKARDADEGGE